MQQQRLRLTAKTLRRALVASDTAWLERALAWYAASHHRHSPPTLDRVRMRALPGMGQFLHGIDDDRGPLFVALWVCATHFDGAADNSPRFDRALAMLRLLVRRVLSPHRPPLTTCYIPLHLSDSARQYARLPLLTVDQEDRLVRLCLEVLCDTATAPWWTTPAQINAARLPLFLIRRLARSGTEGARGTLAHVLDQFAPHLHPPTLVRLLWYVVYSPDIPIAQARLVAARAAPLIPTAFRGLLAEYVLGANLLHVAATRKPSVLLDLLPHHLGAYIAARTLAGGTAWQYVVRGHQQPQQQPTTTRISAPLFHELHLAFVRAELEQHPPLRRAAFLRAARWPPSVCPLARLAPDLLRRIAHQAMRDDYAMAFFAAPPIIARKHALRDTLHRNTHDSDDDDDNDWIM